MLAASIASVLRRLLSSDQNAPGARPRPRSRRTCLLFAAPLSCRNLKINKLKPSGPAPSVGEGGQTVGVPRRSSRVGTPLRPARGSPAPGRSAPPARLPSLRRGKREGRGLGAFWKAAAAGRGLGSAGGGKAETQRGPWGAQGPPARRQAWGTEAVRRGARWRLAAWAAVSGGSWAACQGTRERGGGRRAGSARSAGRPPGPRAASPPPACSPPRTPR